MKQPKMAILRYVRTAAGWSRRVVPTGGGRGWEQRLDQSTRPYGPDVCDLGEYQIRWYEKQGGESKVRYLAGGSTYSGAMAALETQRDRLTLQRTAQRMGVEIPAVGNSKPLKDRLQPFLKDRMATSKITSPETCAMYERAVRDFLEATRVRYVEQVNSEVLATYLTRLQERGLAPYTQLSHYAQVKAFLRACDEGLNKLLGEYTPKVRQKKPVSYNQEQVVRLLAYLRGSERQAGNRRSVKNDLRIALAVEVFWKTGMRSKELSFLTWDMVDLTRGLLHVKDDRQFNLKLRGKEKLVTFRTKTRRDRDLAIPIEAGLLDRLRQWREAHPGDRFLFPTNQGNPDQQIRMAVKVAAYRAGLACGTCEKCRQPCGECRYCKCGACRGCKNGNRCFHPHPGAKPCTRIHCQKWTLHKLRHTFATTLARKGGDLQMLMTLLGHSKLSTTQVYISAIQETQAAQTINRVFGD